jgi:hypothetical protein
MNLRKNPRIFNLVGWRLFWVMACFLILWILLSGHALAGDGKESKNFFPSTMLRSYQNECAACHVAYPPAMLASQSWKNLMGSLNLHYGVDASMDPAAIKEIGAWLQDHSGTYKRIDLAPAEDRITQSAWFVRKHRKIQEEVWIRQSIKRSANCVACHTLAEQGDYGERNIIIPKN